jgi:uncharacterized repeat protein (TIGR01451 family)
VEAHRRTAGLLALVAFAALPLRADEGPVETRLEARVVVRAADGRESFAPAESARPGDVIEYVATYRNGGDHAVKGLEATLPIPAHTELVPGSIRPATARASLDAASFAALPLKRGKELVPYRDYRYLRWQVAQLDPKKSVSFSARVRVVDGS